MYQATSGISSWKLKHDHIILAGVPKGIQDNIQEEPGISRPIPALVIVNSKPVYAQLFTEAEGLYLKIEGYSDLLTMLCGLERSLWDAKIAAFWASYAAKAKTARNRASRKSKAELAKAVKSTVTNNRQTVLPDPRNLDFIPLAKQKPKKVLPGDKRLPRSSDRTGTLPSGRSNAKKARLSVNSSNSEETLSNSPKTYADIARHRDERLDKKPLGEHWLYVTGPNKGPIDKPTFRLVRQLLAKKEFEKRDFDNTYIWCNITTTSYASGRG